MSIKRALRLFEKFAEIPQHAKCKKCGDADPYLNDGLCYKCFDPSEKKEEKKQKNLVQQFNHAILKDPTKFKFDAKSILDNTNKSHGKLKPIDIKDYRILLYEDGFAPRETYEVYITKRGIGGESDEFIPLTPDEFSDKSWYKYFKEDYAVNMPRKEVEKMLEDLQNAS